MTRNQANRPRIIFLFTDAGGGHRSAGEAIIEAVQLEYGDRFELKMVDIMKTYGPPVVNRLPEWYPWMVRSRGLWKLMFLLTDGLPQVKLGMNLLYPYIRRDVMMRTLSPAASRCRARSHINWAVAGTSG